MAASVTIVRDDLTGAATRGLLAARLVDAPDHATDLAGQGLRDTTRIAASDPASGR